MKKISTILLILAICTVAPLEMNAQWKNKKIKGSGNVTETSRTTQPYDEVQVVGSITVNLVSGNEGNITIMADNNLHEYIEVETNGDVLKVKMKKGISYSSKHDIVVTVPFTDLSEVSLTGSGDVTSTKPIKGNSLTFNVVGSGDMILAIDAETVEAKITGSGDMRLSGSANNLEVKVSGSGDFEGYSLNAANTEVYVSGSGDAEVNAKNALKARVNGSGDVRYKGSPEMSDTKVLGSGSIKSN
ncbi:MAG TPA: DUF2807 domain-containing protein [Flavobacteriaceae bacterium]|jgi:hypothetical protein|nr:DUF2807 domain-containing protein [Flavobacteriaceae bacterium]MAY51738.1 DUF2807 domain-containing protein [Flavobacteriaceae bacterium]HBR53442.1 DUF2807 domain-containing protein [Flavobacteriaceae bacterium]HIB48000.1 DUF2807 domain-containing protein [Flavobacteriaceae bacterium]HIN98764.1 DUF2807 domain-containing protein [Flavobacteriaceae bacterium]|tara:strand:+ start:47881 stop:48612 length:732 start_codon:yes stop_codon:yes gene_type:complete